MLLGVEGTRRKRRKEKNVYLNGTTWKWVRRRLWSEKDISFRCETIIRECSFEYINIAFDIRFLKSFRIINTSCVDNVWEIIVLFSYTLSVLSSPRLLPALILLRLRSLRCYTQFWLYFGIFMEKFRTIWTWFIAPRLNAKKKVLCSGCSNFSLVHPRESQFEKFEEQMHFSDRAKIKRKVFRNFSRLECLRLSYCCIYSTAIKYTFLLCFQHKTTYINWDRQHIVAVLKERKNCW